MNRWSTLHSPAWSSLITCVALLGLASCGDDSSPPGSDTDTGAPGDDGSTPTRDLGPTPRDLGPAPPPVPPPPTDAGPSPVDADTGPCDSEGMTRTVPCGRCGLASQTCTGGRWDDPSECMDEQECAAGAVEREELFCGMRSRICDDSCHWRDWSEVSGGGECEAGTSERVTEGCPDGLSAERQCGDDCRWGDPSACVGTCATPPATSRSGADPVCIPEGPFVLGTERYRLDGRNRTDALPIRTITLSSFWIDRAPATRRRVDQCFAEGACPEFRDSGTAMAYEALELDSVVALLGVVPAAEFCDWDGGRLPSEFQWEKAARGPSPDARRHSWGDIDGDCDHHPGPTCPPAPFALTDYPAAVSPFGVRFLGVAGEQTRTLRTTPGTAPDDYSRIEDRDPEGFRPIFGDEFVDPVRRGFGWDPRSAESVLPTASIRDPGNAALIAIRCVY